MAPAAVAGLARRKCSRGARRTAARARRSKCCRRTGRPHRPGSRCASTPHVCNRLQIARMVSCRRAARLARPLMPNIYEVARRAGVSPSTVSRVLSRPDVVSAKTRQRVMRAVDLLGYTPNSTAKNLRQARTGKLLVTVPDISNPFFSLILQGIEDAAQREDYAVLFGDTQHDDSREER